VAWTAGLGGQIRHSEIRPGGAAPAVGEEEREEPERTGRDARESRGQALALPGVALGLRGR